MVVAKRQKTSVVFSKQKTIGLLIALLFFTHNLFASDAVKELLDKAMVAQKKYQETTAIDLYKKVLKIDSINFTALYNIAYLYQRQGWLEEGVNNEKSKQLYTEFKKYALTAYRQYPETFEGNVLMAGAAARMARYLPAKERVHAAWDIKKYADIAYKLNPNHADVLHMLAWWNYELQKPTWLEKKLSDLLFGGLPKGASIENAFLYLQKAIKVNPNYLVYFYDMAVFYLHVGNTVKAKEYLNKAISMKPDSPEEVQYLDLSKKKLASI
jgi:tetratricopeptide (TPR) repeat protein